jgi:hypothetical protein
MVQTFKIAITMKKEQHSDEPINPALRVGDVGGSLLIRSLHLLEEMIDNHDADAVPMSEQHHKEVKKLIKDIRKSKRLQ